MFYGRRFSPLEMQRDRDSNRMNVIGLRAAIILFRIVEIQDYLLARRKFAQQRKSAFQLKFSTGREPVSVPDVEPGVVIDFNGSIRCERASENSEFPFESHAIAIPEGEVAVYDAKVLAIAVG